MIGVVLLTLLAVDWLADRGQKATVLLFTRTDCPISNRYAPEVRRLAESYAARGIEFVLVYPESGVNEASVAQHRREFGYPIPGELDPDHRYVRAAGARVTPEAAVFVRGKLVYRGRIDDRHVDLGQSRAAATRHDLEETLQAILNGKRPARRETKAVGCAIEKL